MGQGDSCLADVSMEKGRRMNSKEILKRSRSNFGLAFLVLPKEQREALSALYAYCRVIDDIVDESTNPKQAEVGLRRWHEILDRFPTPSVFDPVVAHELALAVKRFPIQMDDLRWILYGVETDLYKRRFSTCEELLIYCDGVASAVGFASMAIFGADRKETEAYTYATGRALQLTNIIRDVGADAKRGRIYLPLEDLERFGVKERNLLMGLYDDSFVELMRFQVNRAEEFYLAAESTLSVSLRKRFPAAEMMRKTYRLLLRRIEANRYNVFPKKIRVSRARKMAVWMSVCAPRVLGA